MTSPSVTVTYPRTSSARTTRHVTMDQTIRAPKINLSAVIEDVSGVYD